MAEIADYSVEQERAAPEPKKNRMVRQSRMIRLFGATVDGGEGRMQPSIFLLILIITLVAAAFGNISFWVYHHFTPSAETYVVNINAMEDRAAKLASEIRHTEDVRTEAEMLPIDNIRVRNMDNELSVSGRITNKGYLEIGDIELTVYVIDEKENVILETEHMARSGDGLPLRPGQHRLFYVKVSTIPIPAAEVLVLVTDIEFEGTNYNK